MKYFTKLNFLYLSIIFLGVFFSYFIFYTAPFQKPKIYDCFLFMDEMEMLQIRLNELYDKVDKFVLVESSETFTGKSKAFVFAQNKKLFDRFADKIIYVQVNEHFETDQPLQREKFQRNQIARGLKNCKDHDIIFISNLDEIPRADKIDEIKKNLVQNDFVICSQRMYFGFLNRFAKEESPWNGPVALKFETSKNILPHKIRKLKNLKPKHLEKLGLTTYTVIPDAGWHFSSMGDMERCVKPYQDLSLEISNQTALQNQFGARNANDFYPLVPIDHSYPAFVQKNLPFFRAIGLIDCENN